jgi:hypothetical protein
VQHTLYLQKTMTPEKAYQAALDSFYKIRADEEREAELAREQAAKFGADAGAGKSQGKASLRVFTKLMHVLEEKELKDSVVFMKEQSQMYVFICLYLLVIDFLKLTQFF